MQKQLTNKKLLWWGRFDKNYSRNRILRHLMKELGCQIDDFCPRYSATGKWEAMLRGLSKPNAIWVANFRQNDFFSALYFSKKWQIPIIFDPLISAWDKAVFERKKFSANCLKSQRLLTWERSIFSQADIIIADTKPHADFFIKTLHAPANKTCVIPVGAEEQLFNQQPMDEKKKIEILFYGSFINLQGPETIIEAAKMLPELQFTLLGEGPLKLQCQKLAVDQHNITFENWIPYSELPKRIAHAHILLGIFGGSPKAGRVIPNKAYQAIASGRCLITRRSEAYPSKLLKAPKGIHFVEPASASSLAEKIQQLVQQETDIKAEGQHARKCYEKYFANSRLKKDLLNALYLSGC